MKFIISTLVALSMLAPVAAYGWSETPEESMDDSTFFETTYTQCTFRYTDSALTRRQVDCLCNELAEHAVEWRGKVAADHIPALPDQVEASCIRHP